MTESLSPRRFGIELEVSRRIFNVAYDDRRKNKEWDRARKLLRQLKDQGSISRGWKLKTDTSCGGELVSPPLVQPHGLREIARVCNAFNSYAKTVNKPLTDGECGLHIHIDAEGMTPRTVSNLFAIVHMMEPIIYEMYPSRSFKYCAPIDVNVAQMSRARDWIDVRDAWYRGQNNVKDKTKIYSPAFINGSTGGEYYDGTRYHGFNIHCYWRLGTVEFRYGNGTFDFNHIKAYYEMCLAMVNTAMNSKSRIKPFNGIELNNFERNLEIFKMTYGGRKHLMRVASLCGFSRDTLSLISKLIKKNKSNILQRHPDEMPIFVTKKNAKQFIFLDIDAGRYFNHKGKGFRTKRDAISSAHREYRVSTIEILFGDDGLAKPTRKRTWFSNDFKLKKQEPKKASDSTSNISIGRYWSTYTSSTNSPTD